MNILHYNKKGELTEKLEQSGQTETTVKANNFNEEVVLFQCKGYNNLSELWEKSLEYCHKNNLTEPKIIIEAK